jgi:hypothetical protein
VNDSVEDITDMNFGSLLIFRYTRKFIAGSNPEDNTFWLIGIEADIKNDQHVETRK